jgi:ComF family protein
MIDDDGDSGPQELPAPAGAWRRARGLCSKGARGALNLLLPPLCPITGERVAAPGLLSAKGWLQLQFIDDPVCARCGMPFAHDEGEGAMCAACIAEPPAFDSARAAVLYGDASHKLIVAFKHSDRTELAPLLAGWLARAGRPLFNEGAVIIPCPLHPLRLLHRRYNQAALLALSLSRATGTPTESSLLKRQRDTKPQQRLSAEARRRNVAGAFEVPQALAARADGRRFILVDDVLTTGTTLSACARALKRAGAARVDALVLARVSRSGVEALGAAGDQGP